MVGKIYEAAKWTADTAVGAAKVRLPLSGLINFIAVLFFSFWCYYP